MHTVRNKKDDKREKEGGRESSWKSEREYSKEEFQIKEMERKLQKRNKTFLFNIYFIDQ